MESFILKLYSYLMKIREIITPLKMLSVILIVMGVVDNLINPIEHYTQPNLVTEIALRGAFLLCGFFGLLGNGKTTKVRSFLVGVPYLWLATMYGLAYYNTHIRASILPFIVTLILGLWTVFIGGAYDTGRNISITRSAFDRIDTQPVDEVRRKGTAERRTK